MADVIIIDYGMGNLRSIQHKLKKIGIDALVSSGPSDIGKAQLLIMPGVGNFAKGMENIKQYGILDILNRKVIEERTPIIGICLGMQLFTKRSEEGDVYGLGWIDAETKLFRFNDSKYKVPHIDWKKVKPTKNSLIFEGFRPDQRFYFAHSYHIVCKDFEDILTNSSYGGLEFVSSVHRGNIFGMQFHPEKSHREGMVLIKNFYLSCQSSF